MNRHKDNGLNCVVYQKTNRSYLCVPNSMAGRNDVYTVYLIPETQQGMDSADSFDIVGRELDMKFIKKYLIELDKYNGDFTNYQKSLNDH